MQGIAENNFDYLFKLLLIGDTGVGKSSILIRYTENNFSHSIQSTIGVDFKVKLTEAKGKKIKMTIWDTAGQERFRTLTSSYYRGAQGIMLVYDVTRRETFENLGAWVTEVDTYSPNGGKDVIKLLVANKIDMEDQAVSREEAEAWARSKGMLFVEASAKTRVGVDQCFEELVHKILDSPVLIATATRNQGPTHTIHDPYTPASEPGGCC